MNIVALVVFVVSFVLVGVLYRLGYFCKKRSDSLRQKCSPYECGLDPNASARIPLSLRFFLLAVIFLVLDVEIALLIGVPWVVGNGRPGWRGSVLGVCVFIAILFIGLVHEWREGSLDWV